VKAVVLDPENHFNVDRQLTKDDVQKLIRVRSIFSACSIHKVAYFIIEYI